MSYEKPSSYEECAERYARPETVLARQLIIGKWPDDSSFAPAVAQAGGTIQFGHIAILANGEGVAAEQEATNQVVQLPNIPCRKVVIAFPTSAIIDAGLPEYGNLNSTANGNGRLLFYGDSDGQFFALEAGQAEELEVSNANQIFLRDANFPWEDFNGDSFSTAYELVAFWRVIK